MIDRSRDDNGADEEEQEPIPPVSFETFLVDCPPGSERDVEGLARVSGHASGPLASASYALDTPDIRLHCSHEQCGGVRTFRFRGNVLTDLTDGVAKTVFLVYMCSDCRAETKVFALLVRRTTQGLSRLDGVAVKIGERPAFGPPTPSRLWPMLGNDRDAFIKGMRCESQALGIGAFAYYRRVVENQKDRVLGQIIKVAQRVSESAEIIEALEAARQESHFSKAIEKVKPGVPQSLLINGHNPLLLLHSALSEGLHAQSDEACLDIAHSVRIVLVELADRIAQALKNETELKKAVGRLTAANKPKK